MIQHTFALLLMISIISVGCFENLSKTLGSSIFDSVQESLEVVSEATVAAKNDNESDYEKCLTDGYKNKSGGKKHLTDFEKFKKISAEMNLGSKIECSLKSEMKAKIYESENTTATITMSLEGRSLVEFDAIYSNDGWKIDDIR